MKYSALLVFAIYSLASVVSAAATPTNPTEGYYNCRIKNEIETIRDAFFLSGDYIDSLSTKESVYPLALNATTRYAFGLAVTEIEIEGKMTKVLGAARLKDGVPEIILPFTGDAKLLVLNQDSRTSVYVDSDRFTLRDDFLRAEVSCSKSDTQ